MKRIFNFVLAGCVAAAFVACDDSLDTESYTKQNTSNFPATVNDVNNELAATYGVMNNMNNYPLEMPYYVDDMMSDDCFGGGGDGDDTPKAIEHYTLYNAGAYDNFWQQGYKGIARANALISTIDNVEWKGDTNARNQACGEGYFMRALYTFWLTQHFGDIPLVTSTTVPNPCPDASAEDEIFPQILSDLVSASKLMNKKIDGHATKYAAEALLARAYMFYQGFYKEAGELAKASLAPVELVAQEGVDNTTLTKDAVVAALQDVVTNGGYQLMADFRSLWQYSNRVIKKDYPYIQDMTEMFKNGCAEEIFQIRFGNAATYAGSPATLYPLAYTNYISLYSGLRCNDDAAGSGLVNGEANTFPFGQGWGMSPVAPNMINDWKNAETVDGKTDPRRQASVIDCQNDLEHYVFTTSCTEDGGFAPKKYITVTALSNADGSKVQTWGQTDDYTWWAFEEGWGGKSGANNMQEGHYEDYYLIRYADVLLMLTELTGDAQYMNQVRARVGLPSHNYTWQNIKNERRFELAFEGLRYQDLRRWSGINATETSEICQALQKQDGQAINVMGTWTTMKHMNSSWAKRYVQTKGFLPKPEAQVQLSNGAMKQNAGWDVAEATYKKLY